MDQAQVKQTYEVFSKLEFVTLNKYIKGMKLQYIALITMLSCSQTNSYDIHVHSIQFQLYMYYKESLGTFYIIKNI